MELTAEQIQDNWHGILGIIEENIEEPRKSQLKNLYIKFYLSFKKSKILK